MSLFQGLSTAPTFESGEYMTEGWYDLRIVRCLVKRTQNSGLCYIVEFEVIASGVPQHPAGHKVTWLLKLDKMNIAMPNLKQFLLSVIGINSGDAAAVNQVAPILDNLAEWSHSSKNPLSGMYVHTNNQQVLTREGKPFTKHQFHPFDHARFGTQPADLATLWNMCLMAPPPEPIAAPAAPTGWGAPAPQYGAPPGSPYNGAQGPWQPPAPAPAPAWGGQQPGYQAQIAAAQAAFAGAPRPALPGPAMAPPPMGAPPPYRPPPAPMPPPAAQVAPWDAPGSQKSQDQRAYWAPGMADWQPIPGR